MHALRPAALLFITASMAFAAGCGDDDDGGGSGAERDAAQAVREWTTTEANADTCRTVLSERLVQAMYQSVDRCTGRVAEDKDRPFQRSEVGKAEIDGNTGRVAVTGIEEDGRFSGHVRVALNDGRWQIDGFEDDLIKDLLSKGLEAGIVESMKDDKVPNTDDLVQRSDLEGCLNTKLGQVSEQELTRYGYTIFAQDSSGAAPLKKLAADCLLSTDAGKDILVAAIETGLRKRVTEAGKNPECVLEKFRKEANRDDVIKVASTQFGGGTAGPEGAELGRIAQEAAKTC